MLRDWEILSCHFIPPGYGFDKPSSKWPATLRTLYTALGKVAQHAEELRWYAARDGEIDAILQNGIAIELSQAEAANEAVLATHSTNLIPEINRTLQQIQFLLNELTFKATETKEVFIDRLRKVPRIRIDLLLPILHRHFDKWSEEKPSHPGPTGERLQPGTVAWGVGGMKLPASLVEREVVQDFYLLLDPIAKEAANEWDQLQHHLEHFRSDLQCIETSEDLLEGISCYIEQAEFLPYLQNLDVQNEFEDYSRDLFAHIARRDFEQFRELRRVILKTKLANPVLSTFCSRILEKLREAMEAAIVKKYRPQAQKLAEKHGISYETIHKHGRDSYMLNLLFPRHEPVQGPTVYEPRNEISKEEPQAGAATPSGRTSAKTRKGPLSRMDVPRIIEVIENLYRVIENPDIDRQWMYEAYDEMPISDKEKLKKLVPTVKHVYIIRLAEDWLVHRIMPSGRHTNDICEDIEKASLTRRERNALRRLRRQAIWGTELPHTPSADEYTAFLDEVLQDLKHEDAKDAIGKNKFEEPDAKPQSDSSNFSVKTVTPPADGSLSPPSYFAWGGKNQEMTPRHWQLLNYLSKQQFPIPMQKVIEAVWEKEDGQQIEEGTFRAELSRLNTQLNKIGCPWSYSIKRSQVIKS